MLLIYTAIQLHLNNRIYGNRQSPNMKYLLILLFSILFTHKGLTQSPYIIQIKGKIHDKETNTGLADASIICLHAKDSSRVALSFTDKNGYFVFDSLPRQNLILHITYMGYQPLLYSIKMSTNTESIDVGTLQIKRIGISLSEIKILQTRPPIKISKDTLEFNASHFKTKNNATVEDLFKKIPGIQIDQDGTIRINGEVVKSIMINGKNGLGNSDPKIISRNLQSDLIDKIQVFNKNSEHSLSDGETSKYINITIKKNKQNIFSGELSAAIGTHDRFDTKTNLSRFGEHQQILLIGNGNNTNGVPNINYVGSGGIIRTWNIGASYMEDLNKKTTINASYSMDSKLSREQQKSLKQNFIGDSILLNNQDSKTSSRNTNHGVSLQLEYKPDSLQKITFSTNNLLSYNSDIFSNTYTSTENGKNINNGIVNNSDESNAKTISGGLMYEKKFRKKDRSLNINLNYTDGKSTESQLNISRNTYFTASGESNEDTLNQHFNINSQTQKAIFYINYTEPIKKNGFLTFFFGTDKTNELYDKSTFNYNISNGLYDKYVDSMSNIFKNTSTQHCERISWSAQKNKVNYNIALSILSYNFNNRATNLSNISLQSTILLPTFNLHYSISNNKQLRLGYSKEVQFPGITQLQPIPDVSDPLNIKLGNPSLKPASSHGFNLSYNSFDIKSLRTLFVSINGLVNNNEIVADTKMDSIGRQVTQPFNHSGGYSFSFDFVGGLPIKKRANSISIATKSAFQRSINYVNGNKNVNNKLSITQSITYSSEQLKLFDYIISANINYNNIHYSNLVTNTTNYLVYGAYYSGNINLPFGFIISTFLRYNYTSGLPVSFNNNTWILNASLSKTLFQHKQGMITFQGIDLLKQNKSITRNVQANYIEDVRTNTLDPFFLLKFSYFLGKGKN
jgi:Outer membrane protein beta-barrel family/CarboxypepD_reg-like domain